VDEVCLVAIGTFVIQIEVHADGLLDLVDPGRFAVVLRGECFAVHVGSIVAVDVATLSNPHFPRTIAGISVGHDCLEQIRLVFDEGRVPLRAGIGAGKSEGGGSGRGARGGRAGGPGGGNVAGVGFENVGEECRIERLDEGEGSVDVITKGGDKDTDGGNKGELHG